MTIPTHRRRQYERRAAQLNMTVAEFVAFLDEQQRRTNELNDLMYSRDVQRAAIAKFAANRGRKWVVMR